MYAYMTFGGQGSDSILGLAKKALEKVHELGPNSFQANMAEGYYNYYGFRNYDRAIQYLTLALNLQPNNADVISTIGFVKRRQGRFQESHDLLARSCDLDPQAWRNWFELGYLEFVTRQYKSADEHIRRSLLVLGKRSTMLATYHSFVLGSMNGDLKVAHEALERDADETASWLYKLRSFQFNLVEGKFDAAKNDLPRSVLADPDIDSTAYFTALASLYAKGGRQSEARACYDTASVLAENAVHADPNQYRAHISLGNVLAHLDQKTRAIEEGKKAVELMPLEKDALEAGPDALYGLAQIYAVTGEPDASMDKLEQILSIPNTYSVYFMQYDPDLSSLSALPRFQKMLEKYKPVP
jgi:tetratricopeptide (TPR) repeat protein